MRFVIAVLAVGALRSNAALAEEAAKPAVDFARDIRPIFATHCYECHGGKRQEGGLRLNARDSAFAGGDSGAKAIVPGDMKASRLVQVIDGSDADLRMPPADEGEPLSAEQIELITRWVREGANWPADADLPNEQPSHWAWQRPSKSPLPAVQQADWPRHPIDAFVLRKLEQEGVSPAAEADRYTLARRVHLDLIGLPPTPAQLEAFTSDQGSGAYERMVDRALADPAFGERWARMWLDLARYADSKGYGSDPLRTIWRYRDWVIEAFNRNLPYDQFTIEQLAGDLLPEPTADQILATAFHRNTMANDEGGTDDEEFRVAAVKDRIETTMQVWMGLTMGCAKCHSHKFDPITQREYYQAYAFFNQTEDADRGDEEPKVSTPTRLQQLQLAENREQVAALKQRMAQPPAGLEAELVAWEQTVHEQGKRWVVLEPQRAEIDSALDKNYSMAFTSELKDITAFRLEVIGGDESPSASTEPANASFVLREIRLAVSPAAQKPPAGRFVRVDLPGTKRILSLAEVEVFAGGENVAPQGKATQSSTALAASADRAIDKQTAGEFNKGSVTHTDDEDNPWWEVDLGAVLPLQRVVVWNRSDAGVESRLAGLQVSVLDENRKVAWQRAQPAAPMPSGQFDLLAPTNIEFSEATADVSQKGFPPGKAIDGDDSEKSGWSAGSRSGQLILHTKQPLQLEGASTLSFSLVRSSTAGQPADRFRISAWTAPAPPRAIPHNVQQILNTPPEQRTAEQRANLTKFYWAQSPAGLELLGQIGQLETRAKEIEKQIAPTPIMRELPPDKRRVTQTMVKGNFRLPGDAVEPAVPAAFHPLPGDERRDRLSLARWLVDKKNPLTARVAVNRFWAQLFGVGIVATEEDFGTQGTLPTHPEVLDWLAIEFQEGGWDVKDLLRQIVCSATYRQSSSAGVESLQKDPQNRLLGRGPRARLEAEMVRDQTLAISGLLAKKLGGPSVYPPQPPNLWRAAFNGQRTWDTSTGDDRYRRGMYTYWRRTVPYPSMAAFDAPSREICTLRRISTNTPLQAFVTLNDPVYVEAAQALARRIVREGGQTPEARGEFVLRLALCRPAQPEQIEQLTALYRDELEHYRQDAAAATQIATEPLGPLPEGFEAADLAAWTVVANVILNLDGVLSKR